MGSAVSFAGTAVLALTLLPFRDHLDNATSGLAFIVPLVVGAALGGVVAAVTGVISGFVAYNMLFTLPYGTLAVAHPPDVVGLVVYSLVGALTAVTVTLYQREVEAARRRELEAVTLSEMSRSLISGVGLDAVLRAMVRRARELFGLRTAAVVLPRSPARGELVVVEGDPPDWWTADDAGGGDGLLRSAAADVQSIRLRVDGVTIGWFLVAGDVGASERRVLESFADQAALAINRTALVEHATRVQVLEGVDRLRSALMRSVSHDLRTPLASIRAAAEDLSDPELGLLADDRVLLAATIAQESRRLDRLVGDLLEVSRLEAGHLEVHPQVVEVTDLVESAVGTRSEPRLEVDIGPDLLLVRVDPVLIEQVLRNLIENAQRFTPVGQPLEIRARCAGDEVIVSVADHGPGVTQQEQSRVFEPFYSPANGETPRGSGLGLAICHGFIAAHGGRIWVEPTPGGGATFAFTLPAAPGPPSDVQRGHAGTPVSVEGPRD